MQRIILHGNAYLQIANAAAEPQTVLDRVFHQQLHAESWYPSHQCGCIHLLGIAQALAELHADQAQIVAHDRHFFLHAHQGFFAAGELVA
ncbi:MULTISPECIES: hypothetical protein [Xanthomonas]|uniref:hypothetical protein n=1 Tax=Xanthomonas TaxID=338 RepID=UPI001FD15FD3|nr:MULTISPECIES: hypothetical protein [Xanthomonas]